MTKPCSSCKMEKHLIEFYPRKEGKFGRRSECKVCHKKKNYAPSRPPTPEKRAEIDKRHREKYPEIHALRHKRWTLENPEKVRNNTLKKYGLTKLSYEEMLETQQGKCAICLRYRTEFKFNLSVDHKHSTGKVRGLLCKPCNFLIGLAKDNPTICRNAADYLERTN